MCRKERSAIFGSEPRPAVGEWPAFAYERWMHSNVSDGQTLFDSAGFKAHALLRKMLPERSQHATTPGMCDMGQVRTSCRCHLRHENRRPFFEGSEASTIWQNPDCQAKPTQRVLRSMVGSGPETSSRRICGHFFTFLICCLACACSGNLLPKKKIARKRMEWALETTKGMVDAVPYDGSQLKYCACVGWVGWVPAFNFIELCVPWLWR